MADILSPEDLSKCVRCGSCKARCPIYEEFPEEGLGARGRVMLLRGLATGELKPSKKLSERIYSCLLCGACSGSCPLGVDIGEAVYRGRAFLRKDDGSRKHLRSAVRFSIRRPHTAFRMMRLGRNVILPALAKRGLIPFIPELPDSPFKRETQVFPVHRRKGRVAVFTGCSVNYLFPQLAESLLNVLRHLGYEVIMPKGETCCGAPLRGLGLEEEAAEQARRNYRLFGRLQVEAILSLCPTCTVSLKKEYPRLIGEGLDKATDISVFLRDKLPALGSIDKLAVYHDPCHLVYGLGVKKEPRELILNAGVGLTEDDGGCCGLGGLFCFSNRDMSDRLLEKRVQRIGQTESDVVVTSCPGCLMQLGRAVKDKPVLHLIELIEDAYCFRAAVTDKPEEGKAEEPAVQMGSRLDSSLQ